MRSLDPSDSRAVHLHKQMSKKKSAGGGGTCRAQVAIELSTDEGGREEHSEGRQVSENGDQIMPDSSASTDPRR